MTLKSNTNTPPRIIEAIGIVEPILICYWSEESALNVKGAKAMELYYIAECLIGSSNSSKVKDFIIKSVKNN